LCCPKNPFVPGAMTENDYWIIFSFTCCPSERWECAPRDPSPASVYRPCCTPLETTLNHDYAAGPRRRESSFGSLDRNEALVYLIDLAELVFLLFEAFATPAQL
jgi:hypothetical protein